MHWVELCCGAAAVSLRLLGGSQVAPVVSWMGGKRRQAPAILAAMGVDLERDRVLDIARRWSAAGAVVAVSESLPLDMGDGWHHVDLTPCGRRGAGPEWLTMNREPAAVPARQMALWGAA